MSVWYRIVFYTELPLVFEAFLKASKRGVLHVIKGFKTSYTFLQERSSFLLQHVSHLCMYVYRNVCSKFLWGSRGHSGGATQGIQGPLINNRSLRPKSSSLASASLYTMMRMMELLDDCPYLSSSYFIINIVLDKLND